MLPQATLTLSSNFVPSFFAPKAMLFFNLINREEGISKMLFFPHQEPPHRYLVTPYINIAATVDH